MEASQIVKGYQYASGQYVILQVEELESLRSARDKGLSLERFVDPGQIDPVVFSGRCLYLLPESAPAQRPYLLLAQVMRARNRWGVGRVVMSGHRHAVVLRPLGRLLAMDVSAAESVGLDARGNHARSSRSGCPATGRPLADGRRAVMFLHDAAAPATAAPVAAGQTLPPCLCPTAPLQMDTGPSGSR